MAKYEIEIPDGVIPNGWEPVSFEKPPGDGIYIVCSDGMRGRSAHNLAGPRLILRKIEPVRESRWFGISSDVLGCGFPTLEAVHLVYPKGSVIFRCDIEDGNVVNVALEPAEGGGA